MEISEKVAYLKGLAEGLNLDTDSKEGKLIAAIYPECDPALFTIYKRCGDYIKSKIL